jgi:hypothetical protein
MKLHRLIGMIAGAVLLGAIGTVAPVVPLAAQQGRTGQVHILKDCSGESGVPGSDFCIILSSNLPDLPAGTKIFYDLSAGPSVGPGYFDQNIFIFVSPTQWAVGRCTGPNDINTLGPVGLCTISDGIGPLAGFSARVNVTYSPGGTGSQFGWDGTYRFNPLPAR